ncbi:MAG: phage DNA encapsidation protein [Acholeplasmatales bacterium]|nr:phage DNA encapsidation protein [Acholeplasmatales bacterium]
MAAITRKRDNIHWTLNRLLSYNKTYNYAVSGRGPGKTTDTARYMMKIHKQGYMIVVLRRQIVDISETTITDFQNAYNVLQEEENKIKLTYKKGDMKTGICDVYIEGEEMPFFRLIALSNPKYRLKGQAFDRELAWIIFDEYKISQTEKYLPDEYGKFSELYSTLARFGIQLENGDIKPPRVLFLGNNYSLTDPYMANMNIPPHKVRQGEVITGKDWAFEDIKISDELKEYLLKQNPLFNFGNDAYNKYALEGISVSDQRIRIIENEPQNFKLAAVFYIENKYLGIYRRDTETTKFEDNLEYWITVLDDYNSKRRDVICFDFYSLIEGNVLISVVEKQAFISLKNHFRWRRIAFKSIYEGYLFEQIYNLI